MNERQIEYMEGRLVDAFDDGLLEPVTAFIGRPLSGTEPSEYVFQLIHDRTEQIPERDLEDFYFSFGFADGI